MASGRRIREQKDKGPGNSPYSVPIPQAGLPDSSAPDLSGPGATHGAYKVAATEAHPAPTTGPAEYRRIARLTCHGGDYGRWRAWAKAMQSRARFCTVTRAPPRAHRSDARRDGNTLVRTVRVRRGAFR